MSREMKYLEALREAQDQCMAADSSVTLMGLGVPDPKGVFGSTLGLQEKYGDKRVMDMPLAENAMTGVALGAALVGQRPIISHQRIEFAMVAMEQLLNQAPKWHYMFGGVHKVPMVVRMIIGRGWGQGPQHSQSLQALFAHIPGLKVLMPATAHDAKGLLISAIEDDDPVIFLEHRWLYEISDQVPEKMYRVPIGKARVMRQGSDVTIVAASYMVLEALAAADALQQAGVSAEVLDMRSVRPLDTETILASVNKTGRLIAADTSWNTCGVGAELLALVSERAFSSLKQAPVRLGLPDCPSPTSPVLAAGYYPRHPQITAAALEMFGKPVDPAIFAPPTDRNLDQPDSTFEGPF